MSNTTLVVASLLLWPVIFQGIIWFIVRILPKLRKWKPWRVQTPEVGYPSIWGHYVRADTRWWEQ